jgi:hypothetical protein
MASTTDGATTDEDVRRLVDPHWVAEEVTPKLDAPAPTARA